MKVTTKPSWWHFLMLLLSTLYLLPEAIFNAQLVSLVGQGSPSAEDLEHLEIYGRAVSGVGVALLLADFLPKAMVAKVGRGIISLIALICLVWPVVFYGQKYVIEKTLIEPSSAEQRQFAVYSAALRDALAINSIKINGLDYKADELHSSENLTFLALFGGLLYSDAALSDNLEQDKRKIIASFVQKKAYQDFDQHYTQYSQLYNELVGQYKMYANGSKKYNQTLAGIDQREQGYWQQIEQQVNEGWEKYQQAQKAHIAKASARAQKYGPKIYNYHEKIAKCSDRYKKSSQKDRLSKCYDRAGANYRSDILKAGIGYIPPDYWLIVEDISAAENATSSILMGVLTGGFYTALQAVSLASGGDGGIKDKRYKYTDDPDHYQMLFLKHPKFTQMFVNETDYEFNINSSFAFRGHDTTAKKLRAHFLAKGLKLNNNWKINDRPEFAQAVANKVKAEANRQWNSEMAKHNLSLSPNLSWVAFQLNPQIQAKISDRMGDLYVKNIRADWNKKSFKEKVLDPNIEKRTDKYLAMLNSSKGKFVDGGEYAQYGKQALRSVIIPPISMSLSLFLICLTFSKLPLKLWRLIAPPKNTDKKHPITMLQKLIMPLLILILPVIFISNTFTKDEQSPVNYFLTKVEESSNPVFSYAIRWTLHAQPVLHPLGLAFEDKLKIYQHFSPLSNALANVDILRHSDTSLDAEQQQNRQYMVEQKTKLTITTNVPNANIRIMNIGPKYRSGMILRASRYDIQISATGYKTYRRWHQIDAGEQTLSIELKAQ
ncbi:carboxypeptidase regulatory-like domain-containing protein [Pseudoalteromonas sp. SWXJ133]|uniref:carboxypeptidase-like regulatory domain-containing protein n=1 Tax=Pseudoalteromonas sp. SWXJ133 TaxID=2792069 RepID=UPI0018CD0FA1|nr:carboxypeptidase-like regulatory domain-containing protein [Pseudoalteromonas sp. SWXJ133]MBH0019815.1 carboxypeptidase regulatory-like domain-containing protein [Pseudoalteromonas sp. SWXJ133]